MFNKLSILLNKCITFLLYLLRRIKEMVTSLGINLYKIFIEPEFRIADNLGLEIESLNRKIYKLELEEELLTSRLENILKE